MPRDYARRIDSRQLERGERGRVRPVRRLSVRGARDEPRSRGRRRARRRGVVPLRRRSRAAGPHRVAGRRPTLRQQFHGPLGQRFDLGELKTTGQWNVPLVGGVGERRRREAHCQVLVGKQLFYDANDTRLARDAYMSCASCHNDGGHDGRVWDLTGMGEGLRNTINLRGPAAAHGRLHWTANFDEVQDFEGQIRALAGGTGLMSDAAFNTGTRNQPLGDPKAGVSADLDALAAYVASLSTFAPSPYRTAGGALTPDCCRGPDDFQHTRLRLVP